MKPHNEIPFHSHLTAIQILDNVVLKVAVGNQPYMQQSHHRILQIEHRLDQALKAVLQGIGGKAVEAANSAYKDGTSDQTIAAVQSSIQAAYKRAKGAILVAMTVCIAESYRQGKHDAYWQAQNPKHKRVPYVKPVQKDEAAQPTLVPKFDLADEDMIRALSNQQMMWIGDSFERLDSFSHNEIARIVRATTGEKGLSRTEAAAALQDHLRAHYGIGGDGLRLPANYTNRQLSYFSGIAAVSATTARVNGAIRGMDQLGIKKYEVSNPLDKRTCPICNYMDGRTFSVQSAATLTDELSQAKSPGDVRTLKPWLDDKAIQQLGGKDAAKDSKSANRSLEDRGMGFPPYHMSCRCTVDVTADAEIDYESAGAAASPAPAGANRTALQRLNDAKAKTDSARAANAPKTIDQAQQQIAAFIKKEYGVGAHAAWVQANSPQVAKNSNAHHDGDSGAIHLGAETSKGLEQGLKSGEMKLSHIQTLFHENLHAAGEWKGGKKRSGSITKPDLDDANADYKKPLGRIFEEGAVEYLSTVDAKKLADSMGLAVKEDYHRKYRANGTPDAKHTYLTEVNIAESFMRTAVKQKPGEDLNPAGKALMRKFCLEMQPTKRLDELCTLMSAGGPPLGPMALKSKNSWFKWYATKAYKEGMDVDELNAGLQLLQNCESKNLKGLVEYMDKNGPKGYKVP